MSLDPNDNFIVQRGDKLFKVNNENLMAKIQDDDLLLVARGGTNYKITGAELKTDVGGGGSIPGAVVTSNVTNMEAYPNSGWTSQSVTGPTEDLKSIVYGVVDGQGYYVLTTLNQVWYSTDGTNWTRDTDLGGGGSFVVYDGEPGHEVFVYGYYSSSGYLYWGKPGSWNRVGFFTPDHSGENSLCWYHLDDSGNRYWTTLGGRFSDSYKTSSPEYLPSTNANAWSKGPDWLATNQYYFAQLTDAAYGVNKDGQHVSLVTGIGSPGQIFEADGSGTSYSNVYNNGTNKSYQAVAYGNGTFVAIGRDYSADYQFVYSTTGKSNSWERCKDENGDISTTGYNSGYVDFINNIWLCPDRFSFDGAQWYALEHKNFQIQPTQRHLTFDGTNYMLISNNKIWKSTDGGVGGEFFTFETNAGLDNLSPGEVIKQSETSSATVVSVDLASNKVHVAAVSGDWVTGSPAVGPIRYS